MDIGKSFSYVFDDKDWIKKVLIGGVLNIIPIVNFIPAGYTLRTLKNVSEGRERPLPEWDAWGDDFVKGLMVMIAALIYALPIIVLNVIAGIISALAGSGSSSQDVGAVAGVCMAGTSCLSAIWGIAMAIVLPAGVIKYAKTGEFGCFFRFGELFAFIRDNLGDYLIALLVTLGAAILASIVGSILCGVGLVFTTFWANLVMAHLLGQVGANPTAADAGTVGTVSYGELSQSKPEDTKPLDQAQ